MNKSQKESMIRGMKLLYFCLMSFMFAAIWFQCYDGLIHFESPRRFGALFTGIFVLVFFLLIRIYEGVRISIARVSVIVYSQLLSAIMADVIVYVTVCMLWGHMLPFMPMVWLLVGQIAICVGWSWLVTKLYFALYPPRKTVALYRDEWDVSQMCELGTMTKKYNLQKMICVPDQVDDTVLKELDGAEVVFVRGLPTNERNDVLKYCIQNGIVLYLWPKIGDVMLSGAEQTHMFHVPMMRVARYNPKLEYLVAKRLLDIVISLTGIVFMSPFMLITAVAIKLHDGGPVLYKQIRLTRDEKTFKILKFRSMRMDAEKDGIARLSSGDSDDRITPVGRIIRAIRFDELPQLFNILKGDMSVVGPRPERPEIAEQYMKDIPEFKLRLQAKAGLTGYAQVYGKYNSTPYDKLQMDLLYIARPSLFTDIKLILATIKVLFMKESTEGVEEGQTTARMMSNETVKEKEETPV